MFSIHFLFLNPKRFSYFSRSLLLLFILYYLFSRGFFPLEIFFFFFSKTFLKCKLYILKKKIKFILISENLWLPFKLTKKKEREKLASEISLFSIPQNNIIIKKKKTWRIKRAREKKRENMKKKKKEFEDFRVFCCKVNL